MMYSNILIVEDEARIREIVIDFFKANDFGVYGVSTGKEALKVFSENDISLIILDIMIPDLDGWSVCSRIRRISDVPIIFLTAKADEDDKLMGFDLGADDYVTKPFSPKVLVARAKNLLKRINDKSSEVESIKTIYRSGGIELDTKSAKVLVDKQPVYLSSKKFNLLLYFMENEGIVLTREMILNKVWGYDYYGDLRVVDTHIKLLRKLLGEKSKYIHTIIRTGYKFEVISDEKK